MYYPKLPGCRGVLTAVVVCLSIARSDGGLMHVPADEPTIQQAIDFAANGDLILVSPGTYFENIDYRGKSITVRSVAGPNQTILDGRNAGPVVTFQTSEPAQSVLTGFTIQHGYAAVGGGVMLSGTSPTITRNVFRENTQSAGGFGAAIGGDSASPTIERNTFEANTCATSLLSGVVSFVNGSAPIIINNIFRNNPSLAINLTLPPGYSPVVANHKIVQNSVGLRVDASVPDGTLVCANNIVVGNGIGLLVH